MSDARRLARFLDESGPAGTLVLSGAGISTESGIPDYRGPDGSLRRHTPMQWRTFATDAQARHRYWARSYLGWRRMRAAQPNTGHYALAQLQRHGLVSAIITQNVDGLHQAAGSTDVIELHGGLARVLCMSCDAEFSRQWLDQSLAEANPGFHADISGLNPDGDAEVSQAQLDSFVMVDCPSCGDGRLRPDVVFFGETVPAPRVRHCVELVAQAGALVVLGSSLHVMSGYRFVLQAAKLGVPVAIVNQGPTRGDGHAQLRLDEPLGAVLTRTVSEVLAGSVLAPDKMLG